MLLYPSKMGFWVHSADGCLQEEAVVAVPSQPSFFGAFNAGLTTSKGQLALPQCCPLGC